MSRNVVLGIVLLSSTINANLLMTLDGKMSTSAAGTDVFQIDVPENHTIIITVDQLILSREGYMTIMDGDDAVYIFKMIGSSYITKKKEYSGKRAKQVFLPFNIKTKTNSLLIFYKQTEFLEGFTAHYTTIRPESGSISTYAEGKTAFKIEASENYRIVLSIDELILNRKGYLRIIDGDEDAYTIKMIGSQYITKQRQYSNGPAEQVFLPITLQTKSNSLDVYFEQIESKDGFKARYARFTEQETCSKSGLDEISTNATSVNCDTVALSPVASKCDVTYNCGEIYTQYRKTKRCVNGVWGGDVKCYPLQEIVQNNCSYDLGNITQTSMGCPYTPIEVVYYYLNVENIIIGDPTLGRGSCNAVSCSTSCVFNRYGNLVGFCKYADNPGAIIQWLKCMTCRYRYKCRYTVVFC